MSYLWSVDPERLLQVKARHVPVSSGELASEECAGHNMGEEDLEVWDWEEIKKKGSSGVLHKADNKSLMSSG